MKKKKIQTMFWRKTFFLFIHFNKVNNIDDKFIISIQFHTSIVCKKKKKNKIKSNKIQKMRTLIVALYNYIFMDNF